MHILIIKLSSFGDVIHCLPVLNVLKKNFPGSKIDWLVEKENMGILEDHPYIDRLIILKRKSWMKNLRSVNRLLKEGKRFLRDLRSRHYDIAIDFQGLFRSGLLMGLCKAKRKLGFDRVREMAHLFYNEKVILSTLNQHAVTRYLEIPEYLCAKQQERPEFYLPIHKKAYDEAHNLLHETGINLCTDRKIIFINPNGRWQSKQWPIENFRELSKRLSRQGNEVILIGGPGEREGINKEFSALKGKVYNFAGRTSLKGLAALLTSGVCLVTNDSGPMHLAVAVGLPVVALFGPSNPVRTGPLGWQEDTQRMKVLVSGEHCSPCYKKVCKHRRCMRGISVDHVLKAVNEVLDATGTVPLSAPGEACMSKEPSPWHSIS